MTTASLPTLGCLFDYVVLHARRTPDGTAMVIDDRHISYRDLARDVDSCAKGLLAAGIAKGDRVATLSSPQPQFLIELLAATSIGAIWLGLNPRYTLDEYRHAIGDAEPRLLFAPAQLHGRDFSADIAALMVEYPVLNRVITVDDETSLSAAQLYSDFIAAGAAVSDEALAAARASVLPTDAALLVYTSGSTGKPKGALLPHRGLVRCSLVQLRYWHPDPIRILNFFPINHVGCVGDICAYVLVAGGTIVFQDQFDAEHQLALIEKECITLWGGVPTTIQMSLALENYAAYDLSSIQLIAWSGAAASRELAERLLKICPRLTNAYGMTETVGSVTFVAPCADLDVLTETVGKPVPDYDVKVCSPDGAAVDVGETGEICVRGDFIMMGYWRQPEATAAIIDPEGFLHTGDLATVRADGNLKLVGRIREMFKSGGYNIYPLEIERVIESHSAVAMAAVIGVPDNLYGEIGHAYVVLKSGSTVDEAVLRTHCRDVLANYKIPKRFLLVQTLPMLPIGKIDKQALKLQSQVQGASGGHD